MHSSPTAWDSGLRNEKHHGVDECERREGKVFPDLVRGISASSFLQRSDGGGSPCTWHLNSTLSSTSATWFTGLRTNVGRSATHTKVHTHTQRYTYAHREREKKSCLTALNHHKMSRTSIYKASFHNTKVAYQTRRAAPSRSPSRPPCWLPHTHTSHHRFFGCWRWSTSHPESE